LRHLACLLVLASQHVESPDLKKGEMRRGLLLLLRFAAASVVGRLASVVPRVALVRAHGKTLPSNSSAFA